MREISEQSQSHIEVERNSDLNSEHVRTLDPRSSRMSPSVRDEERLPLVPSEISPPPSEKHAMTRKTRICHIVLMADLSGSKRSMLEILKHLNNAEHEKFVISDGDGPLVDVLAERQIASLKVNLVRRIRPVQDARAFWAIYRLCRKYRFDVVHTHSSKTGVLGRVAARLAGVKAVIHHVRGFAFHEFSPSWEKRVYGFVEKVAGWFCDKVIFVNEHDRLYAVDKHILPARKCLTILNGVDFKKFAISRKQEWRRAIRQQLCIPETAYVVTFAGRLCRQKNPTILCDSIISYFQQASHDTYFVILGDGPDFERVRRAFLPYPWSTRVLMLGWQDQIERFVGASDIFFLPSLWEGMPRTILEAMAMGVPVVASDIKGNREAVDNDSTGYVVPPYASDVFSQRIGELLTDDAKREEFGLKAYSKARMCYDSQVNSMMVLDLYEDLLGVGAGSSVGVPQETV